MKKVKCTKIRDLLPKQVRIGKYYWLDETSIKEDEEYKYAMIFRDPNGTHYIGLMDMSQFVAA